MIYNNIIETVGNTPIVKLGLLSKEAGANIYAKLEFFNPLSSVKDRVGKAMIDEAFKNNLIDQNTKIIEPTSGNTGIALAFICSYKKMDLTLTMPESMSIERQKILKALGANIVLTDAKKGMSGAIEMAKDLAEKTGGFIPGQFENSANPKAHYDNTAKEILKDFSSIDCFITGVGTGGTFSGVSKALKEKFNTHCVALEPKESPVISGGKPAPHKIQGIGAGFIPKNLDLSLIDELFSAESQIAIEWAKKLPKLEGLSVGISGAANIYGAFEMAKKKEFKGKNILTVVPDSIEKYLSILL